MGIAVRHLHEGIFREAIAPDTIRNRPSGAHSIP